MQRLLPNQLLFKPISSIGNTSNALKIHEEEWLQNLNRLILESIEDEFSSFCVADWAKKLWVSERTFHYRIKKITGLTPAKYMRECRLLKAKQILEQGTCSSISEVSFLVGFHKPSYFSALFKQRFGQSPSRLIYCSFGVGGV